MKKHLNVLATSFAVIILLSSCSMSGTKSDTKNRLWNVNINAEIPVLPVLNIDGTPNSEGRNSYAILWESTDTMEVFAKGESLDTICPATINASLTAINAVVQGAFAVGDTIELFLPQGDIDYTGQDGTEALTLSKYFFADGMFIINKADEQSSLLSTRDSIMNPKQAFVAFTFCDESAKPVTISKLTIRSESGHLAVHGGSNQSALQYDELVVNAATPSAQLFVAIRNKLHDRSFADYYDPEADVADSYTLTALSADGATYTASWKARLLYGNVYVAEIMLN